ncbi:MAG: hypothetical protein QOH96_2011 [Blastocatellia bacterium]|nr:hypothetical protein [Blastocatellia bacterium]
MEFSLGNQQTGTNPNLPKYRASWDLNRYLRISIPDRYFPPVESKCKFVIEELFFWSNVTKPDQVSLVYVTQCLSLPNFETPPWSRYQMAFMPQALSLPPIAVSITASADFKAFEISKSATMPASSNFFPASSIVTNASFTIFADITVSVSKREAWA